MGSQDVNQHSSLQDFPQSDPLYQVAFEKAAIGIAVVNLDGRITKSNPALQELFGYTADEIQTKTVQEISHPEDLAKDVALLEEVMAGARDSYHLEKRYYRKDGSLFWGHLTVALTRTADGTPDYVIGTVADITARKQIEAEKSQMAQNLERQVQERTREIQEQETMYRNLFEHAGVGIARVYPDAEKGTISHTNKAVQRFFDYTDEEMKALTVKDISPPEYFEEDHRNLLKLIAREKDFYNMEKQYRRKDGSLVWGLITVTMVRNSQGNGLYTVATLQDITARKRAEEELQRHSGELEQQIEDLSRQQAKRKKTLEENVSLSSTEPPHTRLTQRHLHIMKLYVNHSSNQDMAKKLKVSLRTIERHIQEIKQLMNLSTRDELAQYAREHDLI